MIRVFEEHGPYHRQSADSFFCNRIGIRHKFGFELEVPPVYGCGRLAQNAGVFWGTAPAVHVELHRGECLPLEFPDVHRDVVPSENPVHV